MALGCTVLHDVPGHRFNIDHVVIGPRAVYAVETKSVRKPKENYKVIYDGERLHFPGFADRKRLEPDPIYRRVVLAGAYPALPQLGFSERAVRDGERVVT
jgi:hypothetical protein